MELFYKRRGRHGSSGHLLLQRVNDLADLTEDLVHGQLGVDLSEARTRKM